MPYITHFKDKSEIIYLKEISEELNVQSLAMGWIWLIPETAEKSMDARHV